MNTRNMLLTASLVLVTLTTQAQTVYAGEQTIDKQVYKGLILTLPLPERQVEKEWEAQAKQFGALTNSRSTYRVTTADIRDVSTEPINLTSKIDGNKKSTNLFVAFDLGGGNYVTPGNGNYTAAEKMLKDFANKVIYNDQVRVADETFNEAQRAHQKMVRKGESLANDIESNKKEKERLLRKIDENAQELIRLQKELETNKIDQATALTDMDNKRKGVEAAKLKKPN